MAVPPSINIHEPPNPLHHEEEDDVPAPLSPSKPLSPRFAGFNFSPETLSPRGPSSNQTNSDTNGDGQPDIRQPFNFVPTQYTVGRPPPLSPGKQTDIGRRRGHKYARSSVSHQIILSPAPKTPLQLPTSLPIPTLREFRASMTKEQTTRWIWCFCHLAVAGFVQTKAHGSLSMTTLSHLLFFDALGAFLCVVVDISRNFEVWNRSSISHPFGLERSEVLAGLATSIILLFMGLDLLSHGLTHALENTGGHTPHHAHPEHEGEHVHGSVNFAALASIVSSTISASMLGNHSRIGRTIRLFYMPSFLPSIFRNPSHLLPVSLSLLLLLLPLLLIPLTPELDVAIGFLYALAMVILGARLCYAVGRMLVMSFSGSGLDDVLTELKSNPAVTTVEEAKVWQVHYGLCMANFRIRVKSQDQVERLRERISSLVRNRLGGGYGDGSKGVRWEISSEIIVER